MGDRRKQFQGLVGAAETARLDPASQGRRGWRLPI